MSQDLIEAIEKGLEIFKTREPITGVEWADKYFYLSAESSGIEGRWRTLPYQIFPINIITDDDTAEINWMKSARVGYTKCIVISIGYGVEQKKRNIAVWQPTDGDAQDFTSDEIEPMLRDVPIVGDLLRCKVGMKSKYNTVDKKVFRGAVVDIKGGKSGRNYRRMTKDVAIYDETDGFDSDVDGEGNPFKLGDMRTQTSSFKKSIRGSTPKIKQTSLIEPAVNSCKHIFSRYVPCPHCGVMQRLEFSNLRVKDDEQGNYICQNGCIIDYSSYPEMDANGRWQTVDGLWYDDSCDTYFLPDGTQAERPKRVGLKIWAAYSYYITWAEIAEQWLEAVEKSKRGDSTLLKTFVNTILGESWEEKGESIAATGFAERCEPYTPDAIPNEVLLVTFGADCQGGANPRIEVEFLGHGLEGETWSLDYVIIPGDLEQNSVFENLDDELLRKFTREDGVTLRVEGGFIDSGYLASRVYKFTGPRRNRKIFATKGVNTGLICNKGTWQGSPGKDRAILHTCNVDEAKELIFGRLRKVKEPGPGYCHFPTSYGQNYFDQLTNETKREKKKAGRLIGYEWVKKKSHLGNEPLDCRAYNLAALSLLNPNLPKMKMKLDYEAERISRLGVESVQNKRRPGRRVRDNGIS